MGLSQDKRDLQVNLKRSGHPVKLYLRPAQALAARELYFTSKPC